jgi:hypothetical protein
VAGVDFTLRQVRCPDSRDVLCLNQDRFEVQVTWEAPSGGTGIGIGVELTNDSGYFWFFNSRNVELVVKVLNGCSTPVGNYWVFAAGLTNVATEISVKDTVTGAVKRYRNPLGTAFQPILDTRAFATCDPGQRAADAVEPEPVVEPGPKEEGCFTQGSELCLGDRFLVEAFWRTPGGVSGRARAVILTEDTGYFWFFGPNNVEVVVKVLRACAIDPFNNYWVFAAGLTAVEVRLRVTDTSSGEIKEYVNRQGEPFQPVLDTSAFDTCP